MGIQQAMPDDRDDVAAGCDMVEQALAADDKEALAVLVGYWMARASYWRGRCEVLEGAGKGPECTPPQP